MTSHLAAGAAENWQTGAAASGAHVGKDLFVFGSADLSAALIRHGLFDEYRIGLVPITLGEGNPLFKPDSEPLRLELLQSRPLGDRCLLLRYQPAPAAAAADAS